MATPRLADFSPFRFASARELYAQDIRPRLLLSTADIDQLREIATTTDNGRAIADAIRLRCDQMANHVDQAGDDDAALLTPELLEPHLGGRKIPNLDELALMGLIDDQPRYIAAARTILLAAVRNDQADMQLRATLLHGSGRTVAHAYDLLHAHLSPADRTTLQAWFWQVGIERYLDEAAPAHMNTGGANIPIRMLLGALFSLLALGDDATSFATPEQLDAIRAKLLRLLDATAWGCFGSEGYPHEDVAYGNATLGIIIPLLDAVSRAGWRNPYQRYTRLRQAGDALLRFVQPWGSDMVVLGDAGNNYHDREISLGRLAVETEQPPLLWLMTRLQFPAEDSGQWSGLRHFHCNVPVKGEGFDGTLPAGFYSLIALPHLQKVAHPREARPTPVPTRFIDHERGLVSQRTSWDDNALLLIVDSSQRNTIARGHEHDSAGNVSLTANGEYFGIVRGRYSQRRAQQNVVVIDQPHDGDDAWGYRPTRGRLVSHTPGDLVTWTRLDASQQAGAFWSWRDAGFVQGEGMPPYVWLVDDVNFDDGRTGERAYHWRWHTSPGNQVRLDNDAVHITGWRRGHSMSIHFAIAPMRDNQPSTPVLDSAITRCGSPAYISDELVRQHREKAGDKPWMQVHGPVFECPTINATVTGYNCKMVSLLLPHGPADEATPQFTPINTLANTVGYELRNGNVIDTFLYAFDHGVLQYGDIEGMGRWCQIRRAADTGRVLAHAFAGGGWLNVAGQPLSKP